MISLTVIVETASTLTVGWQPVTGAAGYEFLVDGKRVSNTWDATTKQVKFGKPSTGEHTYSVVALAKQDQGDLLWPAVVPPPSTRLKVAYNSTSGAQHAADWPAIHAQGFNAFICGADETQALLNLRATGSKAWVSAGYWTGSGFSTSDAQALALAENVAKNWADVVVGWYVADEPLNSAANRAAIQQRAALLKSGFPAETVIAYWDASTVAQWKGVVDAFALDAYPSRGGVWDYSVITKLAAAADAAALRYYIVIGAFTDDSGNYPLPTPAQLQKCIDTAASTKQVGSACYSWGATTKVVANQLQNQPNLLAVLKAANTA